MDRRKEKNPASFIEYLLGASHWQVTEVLSDWVFQVSQERGQVSCPRSHRLPCRTPAPDPRPDPRHSHRGPRAPHSWRCPRELVRVGREGELTRPAVGSHHPSTFYLSIFLITERNSTVTSSSQPSTGGKNAAPTPSVPNLEGKPPWPRAGIAANHLANRKFQRPRHICVSSAFSG